jgi:hypothetical protein
MRRTPAKQAPVGKLLEVAKQKAFDSSPFPHALSEMDRRSHAKSPTAFNLKIFHAYQD